MSPLAVHLLSPPCCEWGELPDALEAAGARVFTWTTETANHARQVDVQLARFPDPVHVCLWLVVSRSAWTERAMARDLALDRSLGFESFDALLDGSLKHALRVVSNASLRLGLVREGTIDAEQVIDWLGLKVPA